jgi:hypothetical protein
MTGGASVLINLTQQLPFGIIATDRLFDLCATGRQTRGLPRRRRSGGAPGDPAVSGLRGARL